MYEVVKYIDKLFFYCLKKCGNRHDAEELSSQTVLEVLIAIHNKRKINDLESYIFAVANNQYNKFLKKKISIKEHETNMENTLIETYASDESIKDKIFDDEKFKNMQIQIKTLSSEYLKVLYGFYIEDKTLITISNEMNLPLGTVKRKLFELRNKLTEAVKMERLNGKKAYIPKSYHLAMTGEMGDRAQYPLNVTEGLLARNLLSHSYDNPCTLEDYSLELGISIPYIEDLVNTLLNIGFLIEITKGKYVSNIPFISLSFESKVLSFLSINSNDYLKELLDFCNKHLKEYKEILNLDIEDKSLMWSLMFYVNQVCANRCSKEYEYTFKKYGYNAEYSFVEDGDIPDIKTSLRYTYSNMTSNFGYSSLNYWCFRCNNHINDGKYKYFGIRNSLNAHYVELDALKKSYSLNGRKISTLTEKEKELVDSTQKKNIFKIDNETLKFNYVYFDEKAYLKLIKAIDDSEDMTNLANTLAKLYNKITKISEDYLPNYMKDRVNFLNTSILCDIRSLVVDYFVENGAVELPTEDKLFTYNTIFWEYDSNKK